MSLTNNIKEKISIEVIKTLISRFENFPEDSTSNRNAPFHESFLRAFSDKFEGKVSDIPFFISLASWAHGLSTTLGQNFFENIAQHISNGQKREYTSKKLGNLQLTQFQKDHISNIVNDLSNSTASPHLLNENELLFCEYVEDLVKAWDFSADVFFEDEDSITAIELKSVKPNAGEMRGEKQKILEGKAALYRLYPDKKIKFYIGFPFDPTVNPTLESPTSFNKERFLNSIINMKKYFHPDETLIASELWNYLSGTENTMEEILEIINAIATTTFIEKFQIICNKENKAESEYRTLLREWNLFSEIKLIDNDDVIKRGVQNDKNLIRIYNKNPFNSKGSYDFERYLILNELLTSQ